MQRLWRAWLNSRDGLAFCLTKEAAVRLEIAILVLAVPAAILIAPDWGRRLVLLAALLFLISVELLNTAIEKLCDHVTPQIHPQIKIVKDVGSAAVLVAALASGGVWLAILLGL
jgi:diacylglycerol kinase (ATP)